jgi:hypothetical protein
MTALEELRQLANTPDPRKDAIWRARAEKATWPQIAEALNMSRAGVIKLANAGRNE